MTQYPKTFKGRWEALNKDRSLPYQEIERCNAQEQPTSSIGGYLLDAMCLPFHVFFRARLGREYFTYPKFLLSSLFFLLCLCLIQFRFETGAYVGPFTPGGFRPIPEITFPATFLDFLINLREAVELWSSTFTPSIDKLLNRVHQDQAPIFVFIASYYAVANVRLWGAFIMARFKDATYLDSSGVSTILWMPNFWRWTGVYQVAYLLNIRIDVVKQYLEPACLYLAGQYLLRGSADPNNARIFIGICCLFGAFFLVLQAFLRNRPIRKELRQATRSADKLAAREAIWEDFSTVASNAPANSFSGVTTTQPRP